jgi:hypothetical protein
LLKPTRRHVDTGLMTRRYVALGSLAAVAAVVAVVLLLSMGHSSEPASTAPSPATPSASTPRPVTARASSPARTRTLHATMFSARYPASWTVATAQRRGAVRHQLSSTGRPIDSLDIGPAGTVGVTILETAPSRIVGAFSHGISALLPLIVGTPRTAEGVTRTAAPRAVTLDGAQAAEESYAYMYSGRENVQSDVLVRRGDRLVLIELDGEPAAAGSAEGAFEALMRGWRWR